MSEFVSTRPGEDLKLMPLARLSMGGKQQGIS
jgi:hypothetical protein